MLQTFVSNYFRGNEWNGVRAIDRRTLKAKNLTHHHQLGGRKVVAGPGCRQQQALLSGYPTGPKPTHSPIQRWRERPRWVRDLTGLDTVRLAEATAGWTVRPTGEPAWRAWDEHGGELGFLGA